jgi:predicted aldo/keto reductase-like oxidoreductase
MIEKRMLGETGMAVSRIGISSSFGADTAVYEEASERGCNYFTWGTFLRGRSSSFRSFMRQTIRAGNREKIVLGLLSYSHTGFLGDRFLHSALRQLGTEYVDCLILGYFPKRPPERVIDWALSVKERGLARAIGMTTHNRKLVAPLAAEGIIDFFHFRYNSVHRGAEQDIFPHLNEPRPGLVSFTATDWGNLLKQKKMPPDTVVPSAGDCYRFVLERDEVDVCMMGVRDQSMLRENLSALEKGGMTPEELVRMQTIGDHLYGKPRRNAG